MNRLVGTVRRLVLLTSLACIVGASTGCVGSGPYVWARDLKFPAGAAEPAIQPRDVILVHVTNQPSVSGEFSVREDGQYLQPALGNIAVRDLTPSQLSAFLKDRLKTVVVNPDVTVSIARSATIRVNVVGEVRTPGSYELTRDRSVMAALAAAGWLTEFAGRDDIYVVGHGAERVRFHADELTGAGNASAKFRLRDGDVVVVE